MRLSEFSVKNSLLVNLVSVFILLAGTLAMMNLRRDAFPQVDFDIVTVGTAYPGASAEDVEKFVTIPIEKELKGISGVKEMESTSEEGFSSIGITIDPETSDKDQVVDDIRTAVERVNNLPEGIEEDPLVVEIKSKERPILEISLSGNFSEGVKRQYAEALEDRLLDVKGVASIRRIGWRDREIWVEVYPEKLKEYHVSINEVMDSLRRQNITLPGGLLTTKDTEYSLRISGEFSKAEQVDDVIIRSNDSGVALRIKDVARVVDSFADETRIAKVNKKSAVAMVVIKSEQGDVISVVKDVGTVIDQFKEELPEGMEVTLANDFSYYVKRRLGVLKNNGIIGFFFVLVILFLFLDPLPAFVTALGIPIALFITFLMMSVLGITINLVSMLGLIIVLGMLVDDGIIVAENVYRYVEQGMSPKEAAVKGTEEVVAPVTVTILTTCAAFAPLLFMKDIMGKFIKEIPLIVMIALSASLLEAFLILPSHLYDFVKIKKGSHHNKPHKEKIWYRKILDFYTGSLHFALNHRKKYLLGMFFILGFAIYIWTAHMKTVYFTGEGIEQFFIRVEAKKGTPLEKLNELIAPVEDLVAELPENELDSFRTYLGSIESERGFDPTAKSGTHLGQITVYLTPQQQRKRSPKDITDALRVKLDKIEGFERLYFFRPKEGPPIGRAISIGIKGEDFNVLQEIADKYYQRLKNYPGVSDAEISFNKGKHTLRIEVDENKAQQYYLTVGDIATAVRHAFRGGVATTIKPLKAEKEIDVVVRFIKSKRDDLNSFQNILIPNKFGNLIPFAAVAKVMEEDGFYDIKHLDGKRVLYVLGDVDDELATSSEVNKTLKKEFKEIERQYFGYTVKYSGEFEKGNESKANLMRSFSIAFFAIFMILATMFNSLLQPFIVMIAIPFGLIGVIFAFFAHGRPLSFFGLMGVIGLTGIVVNDSVVLVDFINRLRKEGKDRRSSLIEAGQMRLRPIIMTSVTTIGGLVAVAYGIGGGDPFLKPMALAIVWGLVFSTGLTLIGIPVIYAVLDDVAVRIFKRKQI